MSKTTTELVALLRSPRGLRLMEERAGPSRYRDGKALAIEGAVSWVKVEQDCIEATVGDFAALQVQLWLKDGELAYSCSCMKRYAGSACFHCVATAMHAYREIQPLVGQRGGLSKQPLAETKRAFPVLSAYAKDRWQHRLDQAIRFTGKYDYTTALRVCSEVANCIDALAERLESGDAATVVYLAEYGFDVLAKHIAETRGTESRLHGEMDRLQWLHLDACRLAPPPPRALAKRLFKLELNYVFGLNPRVTDLYNDILGTVGLAAHRRLAESAWDAVAYQQKGDEVDPPARGCTITELMLILAGEDIEARIAIKSRDLTYPAAFTEIIGLSRKACDIEGALSWAEQACRAFDDVDLRRLRAECLQDLHRHGEAMAIVWADYAASPNVVRYQTLQHHAQRAECWPDRRALALDHIRQRIKSDASLSPDSESYWYRTTNSDLVDIFLYEHDVEAAWREANQGGCDRGLWLTLAKAREKSAPEDALRVYRDEIALELENTGTRFYKRAIRHLVRMRAILDRLDELDRFEKLIHELRQTHRRRPALLALFDENGW